MKDVTISFSNDEAARQFMSWLDGQGEQDYWIWMECREEESDNPELTAVQFDYDSDNLRVNCTMGRLDGV